MGVARLKKLEVYAHKTVAEDVLASLQKMACCEIISQEESEEAVEMSAAAAQLQDLDDKIGEARFLLRFLEPFFKDEISGIARAFGEKPELCLDELKKLAANFDIKKFAESMRGLERRLVEIRSEQTQIDGLKDILTHLSDLSYPLELISVGTDRISGVLGTMPVDQIEAWKMAAGEKFGTSVETFVAKYSEKDKDAWVACYYLAESEQDVLELATKHSLSRIEIPKELTLSVGEEIQRLVGKQKSLAKETSAIKVKSEIFAEKWVGTIRSLSDYWNVLLSRIQALDKGESTEQITIIRAWVPENEIEKVQKELSPFKTVTEVVVSDPSEDEDPPTMLVNPRWAFPFETLTKLYGAPKYGAIDPTPLLAPFFFVFFGMCLGDGGYGLVMAGFFLFFLKKFRKMPAGAKQFFMLFVLSGAAAIIVGALTGSWVGDMVDVFPFLHFLKPLKDLPVVLIPMDDPMTFLGLSLVLGVLQIFFGMFVAMYNNFRSGDYIAAVGDQLGWLLFLVGLLLFGGSTKIAGCAGPAKVLTIVGAAILVLTQGREKSGILQKGISGVLSLYNVTSYLGDVLSYSRLLALGLATSAIAMIINMLAVLAAGIPYVGWILAAVLFIGGHLFSVAVNVLGAFVHSLRLQYVEFFSKFYTGGGRLFEPLGYHTQFVTISDRSKK